MKAILKLLTLITFLFAPIANAAELEATQSLSVSDAVQLAMENSPYLKAVQQQSAAEETRASEARSYRMPTVDLNAAYLRTNSPMEVFALELSQETFSMADFFANDPNHPAPITDAMTQLRVSQPLYMGGRITAGIRAGEKMGEAGTHQLDRAEQTVIFNTRTAYLDVILADRYVELMKQMVDTVSQHVNRAEAFFETGFIMEADLLQARIALSDVQQKQISAENNASIARSYLNNTMGVPQDRNFTLTDTFKLEKSKPVNLNKRITNGLDERPDLLAMQAKTEAARYNIDIEKAGFKPRVFLIGELNYHDSDFGGFDGESFKLMAMASFNIFNGKRTRAKVDRARAQSASATQLLKQMEQGVILQIRRAHAQVEEAKKRYAVAKLACEQALENLRIREARYQQGVERTTDLLDADVAYERAATRRLQAKFDYLKAREALDYATGEIQ